jgi:ketosteroid isomerase-like protein
MTSRAEMESALKALYAAREKGDVNGVMKDVAEDAAFELNARGTGVPGMGTLLRGKSAITSAVQDLIANFRIRNWKPVSFIVDGEKVALHWTAEITFVPTGKTEKFDAVDAVTFRDGKIVNFRQNTDTALVKSLIAA